MLMNAILLSHKLTSASVKFTDENDPCKFKSDYFSEFDLNQLTKPDDQFYSNVDTAYLKQIKFNLCADLPGAAEGVHAEITD